MTKGAKSRLYELLNQLESANNKIADYLIANDMDNTTAFLTDCQSLAIAIGTSIDMLEGTGTPAVHDLENYCELLYRTSLGTLDDYEKELSNAINRAKAAFDQIHVRTEVVFLPYQASMWDSLEPIWKKEKGDKDVDVHVIPLPYYEKNSKGEPDSFHCDAERFPSTVDIESYRNYDIKLHHPDRIYIHNPYDGVNRLTCVAEDYYSKTLRHHTEKLIYIPYFVLAEPSLTMLEGLKKYVLLPGVFFSTETWVQSESMKTAYTELLTKQFGEHSIDLWSQRIKVVESPKYAAIMSVKREDLYIPKEWERFLYRKDKTKKKVILYNTTILAMQQGQDKMLDKIERVFRIFEGHKKDVTLLWRPHPLLEATIRSQLPELLDKYLQLVQDYKQNEYGIYDDTADLDRAILLSDAYYGDPSSLVQLCQKVGIPIMIQNPDVE